MPRQYTSFWAHTHSQHNRRLNMKNIRQTIWKLISEPCFRLGQLCSVLRGWRRALLTTVRCCWWPTGWAPSGYGHSRRRRAPPAPRQGLLPNLSSCQEGFILTFRMAEAGFYACGGNNEPDLARCYFCRLISLSLLPALCSAPCFLGPWSELVSAP